MFFELRQYRLRPGKRDAWVKLYESEILPYQSSKGMVIVGSWTVQDDADAFVWMRRFDSEAEREAQYKAVYETDEWKAIAKKVDELLIRESIVVTRLEPTTKSVLR